LNNQETEGLISPWLKNIRLRATANAIPNGSIVLDLACGAGALRSHLPPNCKYYGVDRIDPASRDQFDAFVNLDLSSVDVFQKISEWLPEKKVDVITLIAFIEHVKNPERILEGAFSLLKEDGLLLATTPHPIGRRIHDILAKLHICSPSGADEHEKFLGKQDLERVFSKAMFSINRYQRFLFGLNQLVESRPIVESADPSAFVKIGTQRDTGKFETGD
jgi:2-polyprenyl-3-methyl-5-hydroxy-6-metoxy-1,4-benzoquinol methylase